MNRPPETLWSFKGDSKEKITNTLFPPWKLEYSNVDSHIRNAVKILNESGWVWTFSSCGGKRIENKKHSAYIAFFIRKKSLSLLFEILLKQRHLPIIEISSPWWCNLKGPWTTIVIRGTRRNNRDIKEFETIAKLIRKKGVHK